jgi:hypothetical protein
LLIRYPPFLDSSPSFAHELGSRKRNALVLETEPVKPSRARQVGYNTHARRRQAVGKLHHGRRAFRCRPNQPLERLLWRLLASTQTHLDLGFLQAALLLGFAQSRRDRQPVAMFEHLGSLNRPPRFPLPMPHLAAQTNPAGNEVDVVIIGITVPNCDVLCVIWKAKLAHKVVGNVTPFEAVQPLACW